MKKEVLGIVLLLFISLYCKELNIDVPSCVDISAINIFFNDESSSKQVLCNNYPISNLAQFNYDEYATFPHVNFYNKNKTQILTLIVYPGDSNMNFSKMIIRESINSSKDKINHLTSINSFLTGKGIELGLTKKDLIKILGSKNKTETKSENMEIFKYHISDFKNNKFLQKYNNSEYQGEYKFVNNILVEFSFGFIYP
jgi:hypothetical protein